MQRRAAYPNRMGKLFHRRAGLPDQRFGQREIVKSLVRSHVAVSNETPLYRTKTLQWPESAVRWRSLQRRRWRRMLSQAFINELPTQGTREPLNKSSGKHALRVGMGCEARTAVIA